MRTTALVAAAALSPWAAVAAAPPPLALAVDGASGQQAIDLLGPNLDAVAAWHRRSPEAFRQLLSDPAMRLDRQGRLYAVEPLDGPLPPAPAAAAAGPLGSSAPVLQQAPLDRTFQLHSRATAKRTIYLDFTGAVLTDTAWNSGSAINALPYDFDGDTGSFSDAELERIQYIWQRVAEDFAPLDIDVTTEEPPAGRLTRRDPTDDVYGTTVVITNHNGVYNCSCGGIAYVGVFDMVGNFYKPALVFWDMLGNGEEKYVAEAISHEAGHNLGLSHDGYAGGGYYPGHGTGDTGWAPIMGVGYYQPVVQWSKGEYDTANNLEDDFAVMASYGAPLRVDDHGNSVGTASALTATASGGRLRLSGQGVIETRTDVDYLSFAAGAGPATITVSPAARSPNLDAYIRILRADGSEVARANPTATLGVTLNFTLASAGTYYLVVDGVGLGDPKTNGYSGYGSVGQYKVSGSAPLP
ncbi:MAG: zinc-dependent metalloprotease family protein [Burkholderiaceae bacterium]